VSAVAEAIEALPRLVPPGATALGEGMAAALALFAHGPTEARRMVLDVSGDGAHNQGRPPGPIRDIGVQAGITINALAVLNEEPDLVAHYAAEVIGGPGAFVMHCPDYESFTEAIREKLRREIAGVFIA
jgi:Mg-chelatase subunit ChlD